MFQELKKYYLFQKIPKNPSVTIYLKENEETDKQKARELMHILEFTCLRDLTKNIGIYFDPDDLNTLITTDRVLMEEYEEFEKQFGEFIDAENAQKKSKWILRLELDKDAMLEKNITTRRHTFRIN